MVYDIIDMAAGAACIGNNTLPYLFIQMVIALPGIACPFLKTNRSENKVSSSSVKIERKVLLI